MHDVAARDLTAPPIASLPCDIVAVSEQTMPLVLASPHSGDHYPAEFLAQSRLDPMSLRKSEDSYVDEMFRPGAALGAPLLRANFPRVFIDANREPFELDPQMFEDRVPEFVNTKSPRVAAGLGTIARFAARGDDIYRGKMPFAEALRRVDSFYRPYHAMLKSLIDATVSRFGFCILLDCHSMPSVGSPVEADAGCPRVDFVLGDCFGASCAGAVIACAERTLRTMDYGVRRNAPYSGGFTTRHYGRPQGGVHALQIEVNRALYMNEETLEKDSGFDRFAGRMGDVVAALGGLQATDLLRS